jgi:hypothetical protein
MYRSHQANVSVEGLESKLTLSSMSPTVAVDHAEVTHLDGSLTGTYVTSPGSMLTPTPTLPSIQLHGGGMVSPLGVVAADGTLTAKEGQLTLRCADSTMTETFVLTVNKVFRIGVDVVEAFSYKTTDGLYAGTFVLDFHPQSASPMVPSQVGTFDAKFC